MTQQSIFIQGSIVALITPMHEDGSVHWDEFKTLIEWHIEQGSHALAISGTTGESSTLDTDEHIKTIVEATNIANGRIKIIAGTGSNSTKEAVQLTIEAKKAGADATLSVCPYYNKPTQEGIYQHYKAIAEAADIPVILYNVPGRTVTNIDNETALRLAKIKNIVGIKDATGNLVLGKALIQALQQQGLDTKFAVYSGDDPTARELMLFGALGNISVSANIAPNMMSRMCLAAIDGDSELAQQLDQVLVSLCPHLFCEASPIPVKWALHQMGHVSAGIRLPLTPLAEKYRQPLHEALVQAGII